MPCPDVLSGPEGPNILGRRSGRHSTELVSFSGGNPAGRGWDILGTDVLQSGGGQVEDLASHAPAPPWGSVSARASPRCPQTETGRRRADLDQGGCAVGRGKDRQRSRSPG